MDTSPEHDAEKCEAVFSDKREPFVQTSCSISLPWGHDGVIRHAFHGLGMHKDEPIAVNRQAAVQMGIRVGSAAERCQYGPAGRRLQKFPLTLSSCYRGDEENR